LARSIFTLLLLLITGLCFAQNLPADWYQGKIIRDIQFEGLRHVRRTDLDGVIDPYRGMPFSDNLFLELQGRLYALEYFDLITPTAIPADQAGTEVILLFRVTERPTVSRITFVGNSQVNRRELLDSISTKLNDVANTIMISADETAIRNRYIERGYPDVQVRSESLPARNDTVELVFHITEGTRIIITNIFFEGNTLFSNSTLRGQLSMRARGVGLGRSGAFQETRLITDRNAITRYYHDRGYLDAEVTDIVMDTVQDAQGNNNLTITYRIYEGRSYIFTGITFVGNEIFSDEQLQRLIRSEVGRIANATRLESDIQRTFNLYFENGYIYNDIRPEELRNAEEGTIAFRITIVERGRAHIENIIIRGNTKTKDHVIRREIPLETGDIYSNSKVMTGLRNLMNLQFFSQVFPEPVPGSEDGLMDLIINVEEGLTTDIQFGLTFSGSSNPDDFPISGLLTITDRNFLGYGNQVRAELRASNTNQQLSFSYSQRWLGDLPLSWTVDLSLSHSRRLTPMNNGPGPLFDDNNFPAFPDGYYSYEDYLADNKIPSREFLMEYQQWFISLGLSSVYRWSTMLGTLGTGGGIRTGLVNNTYDDMLRPFDPVIRERNGDWTPVNSLWTLIYLDNRDLYFDPSSGYYASQRVSFHGFLPVELEHYIRSDTKLEAFFTLFDIPVGETWNFKSVLMLHSGMSFIFPQVGNDEPIIENASKLFIDGMFIGRGWYNARESSRGNALWQNTAELRFPLVQGFLAFDMFFDAILTSGLYSDFSESYISPNDFLSNIESEAWRFSYGGGFRFTIAQFPFRFLLAKRFSIVDGQVVMHPGGLFRKASDPNSGLDFVISFAIPTL